MKDFSIDCETLSTKPNAAIISIGCQQFDLETGKMGKTFHSIINLDSAIQNGHVSASTLVWWAMQSESAKELLKQAELSTTHLQTAVCDLNQFIRSSKSDSPITVWGYGATADITWLESAFMKCVGTYPEWQNSFRGIRCLRTLEAASGLTWDHATAAGIEFGTKRHDALDDATNQAKFASFLWRAIKTNMHPDRMIAAEKLVTPKAKPAPATPKPSPAPAPVSFDDDDDL